MEKVIIIFIASTSLLMSCHSNSAEKGVDQYPAILSDPAKRANCVYLTSDEKNQPVISWCETTGKSEEKSFYMAFFNAGSRSFSHPIAIPVEQNTSFHEEGMPKIAIKSNGTIIAVYETSNSTDSNKFAGFVHYIVSADKGKTWTRPACVHADSTKGKSHSFAVITRLSDGEIGACWLDESLDRKAGGRPVKFARTNESNHFENELIIDSVACQCCRIAIHSNPGGKITVAFRDIVNDSIRDMSVTSSDDNGKTFTPAVSFSKDGWVINGCPHNGPAVVAADKNIYATWFTGGRQKGVYYCEMNYKKEVMTKRLVSDQGRFIQLCLLPDGARALAYSETIQEGDKVYSKIVLNKIEHDKIFASNISTEKSMAGYPVLQSFGADKVAVAWCDNDRVYYSLVDSRSINTPVQWAAAKSRFAGYDLSRIKLRVSKDVVCGMPLSMSPADTTLFKGKVYGFCSDICKEKFLTDPAAFTGE